jgi:two-component system nitrogen regulation response regulator NtrX
LGDHQKIEVDVRLIGATSANIQQAIKEGHFREDLYYRLNVVPITLPSLQERVTDIPPLIQYFMQKAALAHGCSPRILSEEATIVLQAYEWPGNIRQLRNVIEWILIMAPGGVQDVVTVEMLPPDTSFNYLSASPSIVVMPLREAREAFEREYLLAQVNRFGGNISKTARFVGMERSALHRKLRALGVYEGRNTEEETESSPEIRIA